MTAVVSSSENITDSEELVQFHEKLVHASQKVGELKLKDIRSFEFEPIEDGNAPYILPVVPYEEPLRKDPKHVLHVMKHLHSMTTADMRKELKKVHVDSRGRRSQIYSRLKKYFRREFAIIRNAELQRNRSELFYDYFVVMDFECTCEAELHDYDHEIIEFPAILVDVRRKEIVDIFHAYVRPTINPQLSDFCSKFTGITQDLVDKALPFVDVLDSFRVWMQSHRLGQEGARYAFVTDGPWDIAKFFQMQCTQSKLGAVPHDFRFYINIRKIFLNRYSRGLPIKKINLSGMLAAFDMTFEGREHSGLDDSKNIARIVVKMLEDRTELRINEKLVRAKEGRKSLPESMSKDDRGRQSWRDTLPYKIQQISRDSFISGEYLDCDTCEEDD